MQLVPKMRIPAEDESGSTELQEEMNRFYLFCSLTTLSNMMDLVNSLLNNILLTHRSQPDVEVPSCKRSIRQSLRRV